MMEIEKFRPGIGSPSNLMTDFSQIHTIYLNASKIYPKETLFYFSWCFNRALPIISPFIVVFTTEIVQKIAPAYTIHKG